MAARKLPDIDYVREALSYDPATGIFIWRERPAHHFPDAKTWNPQNLEHQICREASWIHEPSWAAPDFLGNSVAVFLARSRLTASRGCWSTESPSPS